MNITNRYAETEVSGMNQVELESRALIRTASRLNQIKENWEQSNDSLSEALEKNRRLWSIIASAMGDNTSPQPEELRKNILNLSMFVFKRTLEILANPKPESLDILININMNSTIRTLLYSLSPVQSSLMPRIVLRKGMCKHQCIFC